MDYNIYIHDRTSQNKPTQARTTGGSFTTSKTSETQQTSGFSIGSMVSSQKFAKFGKFGIAIAVVAAAVKIGDSVVSTIEPFVTRETGDYRFSVAYNNVKSMISAVTNPFQTALSTLTNIQETRLFNQRQEQQRLLIGDSVVNSLTRKV